MFQSSSFVAFILFWSGIFLFDSFLKNYKKYSRHYQEYLESNGISLSVGQVKWYTGRFNRTFMRLGQFWPHSLYLWFSVGVIVGMVTMFASVIVLSVTLLQAFKKDSEQLLTPVMPGVTLPWNQVIYYLMSLTISGIFHETGHAIAAVREQVRVNGFGLFFVVLYPGAFVDLYTEHLNVISPIRQLRIYCAGIWHNWVLVLVGLVILWFLPFFLLPLYTSGQSAVVMKVLENSPVKGSLEVGAHVTSLGTCRVRNSRDWTRCVTEILSTPSDGHCNDLMTIIRKNSSLGTYQNGDVIDCCGNATSSRFCFKYESLSNHKGYACLPARTTTARPTCQVPQDCDGPGDKVCVQPSLDNSSRLLRILHSRGPDILYVGDLVLLQFTVIVTDYSPLSSFLPMELPTVLETFLVYLVSISGALGLLNMTPCYALDGQWALYAFVDYSLSGHLPQENDRNTLCNIILTCGSILLAANIAVALWTIFGL